MRAWFEAATEGDDSAVFGACHNSQPESLVVGAEPGLLVSSKMPRPLGFIVCFPACSAAQISGFDENFMKGFWYDDDDFFYRMWKDAGLNFAFVDSIHGVHLHHERPGLKTRDGQLGILRNEKLMRKKHGSAHVWATLEKTVQYGDGITTWRHA